MRSEKPDVQESLATLREAHSTCKAGSSLDLGPHLTLASQNTGPEEQEFSSFQNENVSIFM